tara:strand:+ start:114 stop:404 length:291 start_codon:yes stop_codon:yes gene_type:complete
MKWFSVIKNIDMDRLKEEVNAINAMIEDYVSERDSARDKLDDLIYSIGQKILDGELYVDKDIRRIAENMQRKSGFDVEDFDELKERMDAKLGIDVE